MTYSAGDAQARFLLDLTPLEQNARRASQILTDLEQKAGKVTLGGAATDAKTLQAQAKLANAQAAQTRAATAQAAAQTKLQQAQDKSAISAAKLAAEEAKAAAALQKQAQATAQAETAQARLAATQQRAARAGQNGGLGPALPRTFAGFTPQGFAQAAGAFGLFNVGPQLVGQGIGATIDAGRRSLELQATLNLTKELTGTQAQYNKVIEAAREQQRLYGGSLQENIAGISGLVISARSSGAELTTLINLAQRLAVLDPAQGAEGARIALSEALAGDPVSLARRYEIPRAALERIKDESLSTTERLAVLDQYLNKIGITSEVAGKTITQQAQAYNALNAELDTLTTSFGKLVSDGFAPAATGSERVLSGLNGFIASLQGGQGVVEQAQQGLARTSGTYEEYISRVHAARDAAKSQIDGIAAGFGPFSGLVGLIGEAANSNEVLSRAQYEALRATELQAAATGIASQVTQQAAAATALLTDEERKGIVAKSESAGQSERLSAVQASIAFISDQVSKGLISQANAAQIFARDFGFAADEADRLAAAAAAAANKPSDRGADNAGAVSAAELATIRLEREQAIAEAKSRQTLATGSRAEVIAERQRLLNNAVRQFGKNSAEAIDAQTALDQARERGAKATTKAADQTASTLMRLEDRTEDYYTRVLKLQEDYQEKSRRSQEDFELQRSRDTEDFQIERQRLLAEGKIKEAQLLEEEFRRTQARNAQDQARERQRAAEDVAKQQAALAADLGVDTGRIADRAALRGVRVSGAAPGVAAQASGGTLPTVPAVPVTSGAMGMLRIDLRTSTSLDGKTIADVTYPYIETRLDEALAAGVITVDLTQPPGGGQGTAVGGPRP